MSLLSNDQIVTTCFDDAHAGYYSYIWAAVLDADAFQAFKDKDLFDQELAAKFRKYVLGLSGSDDAMKLYREFRGRDPEIEPLLKKRGLM